MNEHMFPPTPPPPPPPPRKAPSGGFRATMENILSVINLIRGLMKTLLLFLFIIFFLALAATGDENVSFGRNFSVIKIEGIIVNERGFGEGGYDHDATIEFIRDLPDNPNNKGILLYLDTPGGTLYHSDELYLALVDYKQATGRPVHAYMSSMCASGGVYISMAADFISIGRSSITGSVGTVFTLYDTEELFDKLGIRTVAIDSGEHKSAGALGLGITPQQEEIFQSMINESFDMFTELVAEGRNLTQRDVREFADGRLLSPRQALEANLVDEISTWDKVLSEFEELTGAPPFYPSLSNNSFMGAFFSQAKNIFPKNETEIALSELKKFPRGVPLVIAPELVN